MGGEDLKKSNLTWDSAQDTAARGVPISGLKVVFTASRLPHEYVSFLQWCSQRLPDTLSWCYTRRSAPNRDAAIAIGVADTAGVVCVIMVLVDLVSGDE